MDVRPAKKRSTQSNKTTSKSTVVTSKAPIKLKKSAKTKSSPKHTLLKRLINHPLRSHPFALPVMTFVLLSFIAMTSFVVSNGKTVGASDTKLVNLSIDGKQQVIPTRAQTVQDFLERLNISVEEKDIVEPALDTEILDSNFSVTFHNARAVTIVDGDNEITTVTAAPAPRDAAQAAGVMVYPEDKVEARGAVIETEDVLRGDLVAETIVIDRATPAIINLYGSNIPVRTHVATVGDALKEKNIQTLPDDVITPSVDTPLTPQTQIFVTRFGRQIDAREETIAAPVETINDPNLTVGTTQIRQAGNAGRKVVTYEVELQNGIEIARKPIQEIIAVEAVKQIVVKGTKQPTIIVAGDHAALMSAAGIPESQHGSASFIISRESGWRLNARNAGGCLGLGQACPGTKLTNACPNYANDADCQLRFFNGYAVGRYGSWNAAYNFWQVNHWW